MPKSYELTEEQVKIICDLIEKDVGWARDYTPFASQERRDWLLPLKAIAEVFGAAELARYADEPIDQKP